MTVTHARPNPLLVSPSDAATMLGVSLRTIYRMAQRGDFRMKKVGGARTGIPRADIDAYLDSLPDVYGR